MQRITLESLGMPALGADVRAALRGELKRAQRAGDVLIISGNEGAWNHSRIDGDARNAAELHALALAVIAHPAPVIAVLAGEVTDFGFALAAAADVRIAAAGTTAQISQPGAALETGAHRLLTRLLGTARSDDLVYTGRRWSSDEALAAGFLSRASAAPDDVEALAHALAAPAGAAVKRAAIAGVASQLTEQLAYDAWLALTATGEAS